ncbi:MAG TPA: UDP-glucose/GDP-mannose dehydrogenase family protein [Longimicrobiales bacterium]|nr:UDP-glucose/GDP-mannose dehydrogenase family protein [Longimicrobiales bacterium]
MDITVIGTGYVGLVVATCFAESGNDVVGADLDDAKIDMLREGRSPIYEPGLEALLERNLEQGRLRFTTDVGAAVRQADVIVIAVGTPPDEDGSADVSHVLDVAGAIGDHMDRPKVVVTKSTIPVGTSDRVRETIEARTPHPVHVAFNPEFLKEGSAVADFMKPDRVIIGTDSEEARDILTDLHEPFVRSGNPILYMDVRSAEITKYAANAMLATRISFMNTIARLCDAVGADVSAVRKGIGSDDRIGPRFLFPGVGYGGSCFPKDVKALAASLRRTGVDPVILDAVERVNEGQKRLLLDAIDESFPQGLDGRTVAIWGLSFKPGTDDMREAPSLVVIEGLLERGADVRVHDFQALEEARRHLGERVAYCEGNYDALEGADALLVITEWQPYRRPDFERMKTSMRRPLILDGRNLYEPSRMREMGFEYRGVGRGAAAPEFVAQA